MARLTNHDDDDAAPPTGGGPQEAEEAEEAGGSLRPSVAMSPLSPVSDSGANTPISRDTAVAAGVENHPSPDSAPVPVAQAATALEMEEMRSKRGVEEVDSPRDDAPVPVEMMDTSYDRAEKGRVEVVGGDDEGPRPQAQSIEDGSNAKIEAKRASSGIASRQVQARAAAIIESKSAESSAAQPRAAMGSSGTSDDVEDAHPTLLTPTVRPPPPSMLPRNSSSTASAEPSVPILQAHLVEDESERPVYDAVPVGEEHWAKRHQKKIIGVFFLVIVAMAVAFGAAFGTGSDDATAMVYGSQCFTSSGELQAAVNGYIAGGAACSRGDSECEILETYGWPIGTWCTSNVTDMSELFQGKDLFNEDLSSWDTSKVTTMAEMFWDASSFNGDVSNWDTSKVTSMENMFDMARAFNGDVSNWDTSNVTSMYSMFYEASSFNGDLSNFDTSRVTSMEGMFSEASVFNQNVSNWDTSKVTSMIGMFAGAKAFNGDVSNFDTSSVTSMQYMFAEASSFNGDVSHFDTSRVTSMEGMFGWTNSFNGDVGNFDTSNVTTMYWMFSDATSFNQDVSGWDVASVTDMRHMFGGATFFSQNLCAWGVHYNTIVSLAETVDWIDDPYDGMFNGTSCPNQNDPAGPYSNWCAATCDSDGQASTCHDVEVSILLDSSPLGVGYRLSKFESNGIETAIDSFRFDDSLANERYTRTYCLETGRYSFYMFDRSGDGICCSKGNGEYAVSSEGATLAQGGEFETFSEEAVFDIPAVA